MKKIKYNKLIRDRVPMNMRRKGTAFRVTRLTPAALKKALLIKVGEEASSLPALSKPVEIADELGDILDVIDEVQRVYKISPQQVRTARKQAAKKKVGFRQRYFLHWAADDGYKTNERRNSRRR